jgi:hypothetical protein
MFGREGDVRADLAGHQLVVPGENLDRHAALTKRRERGSGSLLWGIEERYVADQHEIRLIGLRICRVRRTLPEIPSGHGEHAETIGAQRVVFLPKRIEKGWFRR